MKHVKFVVIVGDAGTGKTTYAQRLKAHYGCRRVVDEFDFYRGRDGTIKTSHKIHDGDLCLTRDDVQQHFFPGAKIVSIEDAKKAIGVAA